MYQRAYYYSEFAHAITWADYGNNDINGDNSEPLYDVDPDLDAVAFDMWLNDDNSIIEYLNRHTINEKD